MLGRTALLFPTAFLLSIVPACASEDSSGDQGSQSMTIAQYIKAQAEMGCRRSFSCCTGSSSDDQNLAKNNRQGALSAQECAAAPMHSSYDDEQKSLEDGVKAGNVVFSGSAAAACISAMGQMSCADFFNDRSDHLPAACAGVTEGKLGVGDICAASFECTAGLGCIGSPSKGYKCQTIPALGETCTGYCPYPLYCSETSYVCSEPKPQGASCDPYGALFECQGLCDFDTKICGAPFEFTPACVGG